MKDYFIFHDHIYQCTGTSLNKLNKDSSILRNIEKAGICVVDIDVEMISAAEAQVEKKDSMLARKFSKLHPKTEYILQDEKINENLYQVIGVKNEKIKEFYALIPGRKVEILIPYCLALRQFLADRLIDRDNGVVFIDDLIDSKLITIFYGLLFSVTRSIKASEIDILDSEIKRSEIGFGKKIEEFEPGKTFDWKILTNDMTIVGHLSNKDKSIEVGFIDVRFPAIEGLRIIERSESMIKFLLPEEIKEKRKMQVLKARFLTIMTAALILVVGSGWALFNLINWISAKHENKELISKNNRLLDELVAIDMKTYREDLRLRKNLNYALAYSKVLNLLPISYDLYSIRYVLTDHWKMDVLVLSNEKEFYDEIPRINILQDAAINDYLINDKPAKRVQIDL